jgi:hypothetical protein
MRELGHYLERLGPVFAVLFFTMIIMTAVFAIVVSTRRLAHRP